ncbi:hypothetical protein BJX64DRAFT_285395 [Aspergillus heterothallicus]
MPISQRELVLRRRKTANACTFCREHRVRCEAVTPCPPCVANNVACVRSRPAKAPRRKIQAHNGDESDCQQGHRHSDEVTFVDTHHPAEDASTPTSPPTPTPSTRLEWTSHKTDSILGFIARINAFCSKVPQQCADTAPSGDPFPDQTLPFLSGISPGTQAADCDLSPIQINRIMQIFWSRLRPLMPIVQWHELLPSSEHPHAFQPLQDAIVVYTLHYIYYSGLHTRLVGLDWPQFQDSQSTIGLPYFQRALSAVTQLATFARPSIPVMQAYCFLTLYLLDAGQHQAAYVVVGLGLRIAQSLNYMDARNGRYRDCQLFRHVWWTLIHLEFRCSRHVGKPVTGHVDGLVGLSPTREARDLDYSRGVAYHVESIRLTAAALSINQAMAAAGNTDIESRTAILSEGLRALKQWRDELPDHDPFTNLHLDGISTPSNDPKEIPIELDQPPMLALQNTLLALQYHNTTMTLHRTFIQFPTPSPSKTTATSTSTNASPSPPPTSLIPPSQHALTALSHAHSLLHLTHTRLSTPLPLHHGHPEIYQSAWNATITLVGFMLAYPDSVPERRSACASLHLALDVFRSARAETAAARAVGLAGYLGAKVAGLVGGLEMGMDSTPPSGVLGGRGSGSGAGAGRNEGDTTTTTTTTTTTATANMSADFTTGVDNARLSSVDGQPQPLWPWDELGNLDAWPSYCDTKFSKHSYHGRSHGGGACGVRIYDGL